MEQNSTITVITRIEAALDRIEAALAAPGKGSVRRTEALLLARHAALRDATERALAELTSVIERLPADSAAAGGE